MKTNQEIAQEILAGKWGNGAERRERLTAAGYNYNDVQSIVNAMVYGDPLPVQAAEPEQPARKTMNIEYDPEQYDGIEITVLI
jgi:hypothetical protein